MKTAEQFARELLKILDTGNDTASVVERVRSACNHALASFPPALVEKRVAEAESVLQSLGLPASRLGAFTLLALAQVGATQPWSKAQRKSLRLHDILTWINEQYGVQYAENTRESLRRDVIAPMVQAGILERNPDSPGLPPNHPRNHYAIRASVLERLKQPGENSAR
jgi:hypothetical protein